MCLCAHMFVYTCVCVFVCTYVGVQVPGGRIWYTGTVWACWLNLRSRGLRDPRQSIPCVHTSVSLMATQVRGSPAKWLLSICQKTEENEKTSGVQTALKADTQRRCERWVSYFLLQGVRGPAETSLRLQCRLVITGKHTNERKFWEGQRRPFRERGAGRPPGSECIFKQRAEKQSKGHRLTSQTLG